MLRKIFYLGAGLFLLSLVVAGINSSTQKNKQTDAVIEEFNKLTDFAITTLGDAPNLENIQNAQTILEERKVSLKAKLNSLKLTDLERTNPDKANEIRECFDNNVSKFVAVYQKLLKQWYGDLNRVNELRDQYRKLSPSASFAERKNIEKELVDKRNAIESNIELLNALNETTETFKSIFTE